MALTTPQLYALFAMAVAVAVLIGITYCAGLKTGRKAASSTIHHLENLIDRNRAALAKRKAELIEVNHTLDKREGALSKLRRSLIEEQRDHTNVMAALRQALQKAHANRLNHDDWLNLKLAAKQLGIAAQQFTRSGSNKVNQAALAQSSINAMAERVKDTIDHPPRLCEMAAHGVTDTTFREQEAERAA